MTRILNMVFATVFSTFSTFGFNRQHMLTIVHITGGIDYNFTTQSLTMHSGERRCTSIEILDDAIVEQTTERVSVRFRTSPSYGAAAYHYVHIYIQDNDGM